MSAHRIEGVGPAHQNPLPALLSKLVFAQVGSEQDTDVVLAFILYMKNVGDWIRIIALEVLNNGDALQTLARGPGNRKKCYLSTLVLVLTFQ